MKAEIAKYGPISCGIQNTENFFKKFKGGIYEEFIKNPILNTEVGIIGYDYNLETV